MKKLTISIIFVLFSYGIIFAQSKYDVYAKLKNENLAKELIFTNDSTLVAIYDMNENELREFHFFSFDGKERKAIHLACPGNSQVIIEIFYQRVKSRNLKRIGLQGSIIIYQEI